MIAVLSLIGVSIVDRRTSLFRRPTNDGKEKACSSIRFSRNPILQQIFELYPAAQFHCLDNPPDGNHVGGVAHVNPLACRHLQDAVERLGQLGIQAL